MALPLLYHQRSPGIHKERDFKKEKHNERKKREADIGTIHGKVAKRGGRQQLLHNQIKRQDERHRCIRPADASDGKPRPPRSLTSPRQGADFPFAPLHPLTLPLPASADSRTSACPAKPSPATRRRVHRRRPRRHPAPVVRSRAGWWWRAGGRPERWPRRGKSGRRTSRRPLAFAATHRAAPPALARCRVTPR